MRYIIKLNKYLLPLLLFLVFLGSCSKQEVANEAPDFEEASWPVYRGDRALSGTGEGELPDNMSLLWSFQTEMPVMSSPVIGFGNTYIGSTDGKVYAINLEDGSQVWEYDTGDDIEAPPLLLDNSIYIGNLSGYFHSLDAHTGELLWRNECRNSIYGSANWVQDPESQNTLIIVGCYDNRLYSFDAATGELQWTYETGGYINGAPATDGEHIVFGGCDEYLHILSVQDGSKIGEVLAGSYVPGSPVLVDNRAYLGHYGFQLLCIDITGQEIVWEYEDPDHPDAFFSSPAVGEDRVLIGSRDGYLHCVDRETGEKIWEFQSRDFIDSSPVISGNKVVAASMDGRIYLVDLMDGSEIWSYEIGAEISGSPAVSGGMIIIGAGDGRVYAFRGSS